MLLIAHRAGTDKYPEQCMDAVRFSLASGADMAEVDIRYTLDPQVPVICHDPNVKRVFGVDSNISDLTLEQFLSLKQISDPTKGTYTLKDLLTITAPSPAPSQTSTPNPTPNANPAQNPAQSNTILLHVKMTVDRFAPILRTIHECKAEDRVVLGVQEVDCVQAVKDDCPTIKVLSFMHSPEDLKPFLDTSCEYIRLWEEWVTKERIDLIHKAGKQVWIMSGHPKNDVGYTDWSNLAKWQSMGADGVLINEILKARQFI